MNFNEILPLLRFGGTLGSLCAAARRDDYNGQISHPFGWPYELHACTLEFFQNLGFMSFPGIW
jgi:hypothetical protein